MAGNGYDAQNGPKKSNQLSRKYLWTVFLAVLCIALVLTAALFFLYVSVQVAKTTEYTVGQLEQACASTDILYNSMRAVVNQAIADSDTASFLLGTQTDRLQEARVGVKLRSWRIANPYMICGMSLCITTKAAAMSPAPARETAAPWTWRSCTAAWRTSPMPAFCG